MFLFVLKRQEGKGNLKVPNSNSRFVIGKVYATYQKIDDTYKIDQDIPDQNEDLSKLTICLTMTGCHFG